MIPSWVPRPIIGRRVSRTDNPRHQGVVAAVRWGGLIQVKWDCGWIEEGLDFSQGDLEINRE